MCTIHRITNKINTMSSGRTCTAQNSDTVGDFEQEFRQIIKDGNKIQICRVIFQEFFTNCSIQGFQYFCERKRHWSERVFWMIMFIIATYSSCLMIHDSYIKWDQSPVIVSLSEKATPVWKLPFPAVTICPMGKTSRAKVNWTYTEVQHMFREFLGYTNVSIDPSGKMMKQMEALLQTCGTEIPFDFGNNFTDASVIQTLKYMSINLHEFMDVCIWQKYRNCSNFFQPILTEDGFCFTFNSLNSRDIYTDKVAPELFTVTGHPNATNWNMEQGYNDKLKGECSLKFYPHRVIGTGPTNGLTILLHLDLDHVDYFGQIPIRGFKVILHAPAEIPQSMKNFFIVPIGERVFVSVRPDMVETSKELHDYPPNRKLCFMDSENPLKFFKVYTQRHCELECTSKFMEKECGCVYYAYARNNTTPICGIAKFKCAAEIEAKMAELAFLDSLNSADSAQKICNCLPSCTSINYNIEISSAKFDFNRYVNPDTMYYPFDVNKTAIGILNINFKDKQFITSKRSELYGLTDFLAVCGGLLGLFIGVTALSFVEIFYYFTLRLAWTLQMYRFCKNKKSATLIMTKIHSLNDINIAAKDEVCNLNQL